MTNPVQEMNDVLAIMKAKQDYPEANLWYLYDIYSKEKQLFISNVPNILNYFVDIIKARPTQSNSKILYRIVI